MHEKKKETLVRTHLVLQIQFSQKINWTSLGEAKRSDRGRITKLTRLRMTLMMYIENENNFLESIKSTCVTSKQVKGYLNFMALNREIFIST